MKLVDLPLDQILEAPWNPNRMDDATRSRLRQSIKRFDLIVPLVVRQIEEKRYEAVGGAQRLSVLREMGISSTKCVVVHADDKEARLLSQALNRISGEDDLGLRAELLNEVLESFPQNDVLSLLPETAASLNAMVLR